MTQVVKVTKGFSAGPLETFEEGETVEYAYVEKTIGKGQARHYLNQGRLVGVDGPVDTGPVDTLPPEADIHLSAPPAVPVAPGQEKPEGVSATIPALPGDETVAQAQADAKAARKPAADAKAAKADAGTPAGKLPEPAKR